MLRHFFRLFRSLVHIACHMAPAQEPALLSSIQQIVRDFLKIEHPNI